MSRKLAAFGIVLSFVLALAGGTPAVGQCRAPVEVVFFEGHVGTLVLTPTGKVFVVDANVQAAAQMVTFLHQRGIKEIDALLVTHPHGDHFAGIPRLLSTFKVKRLIDNGYKVNDLAANTKDTRVRRKYRDTVVNRFKARGGTYVTDVKAGRKIELDKELEITLLGPRQQGYASAVTEERLTNKHSIVTFIRHKDVGIMLPGDAPEDTQANIAHAYPRETRDTDVILLPHHGRIYCDHGFARVLGTANPQARVGVASRDAKPGCIAQWKNAGLRLYHTDAGSGDVTIESTGDSFTVSTEKGKKVDRFEAK